ncbi:hypothetical protein GWK47_024088 [Chionoecetes opilio]|uniref:Uncharacterized protein n=1 Tax=Chionoecetes opilio TaxID=41210 RepID=A0A8J4XLL9_CHIOP|nr:hypothetical protein GWK47_024088 [Chionoecetes opilio]
MRISAKGWPVIFPDKIAVTQTIRFYARSRKSGGLWREMCRCPFTRGFSSCPSAAARLSQLDSIVTQPLVEDKNPCSPSCLRSFLMFLLLFINSDSGKGSWAEVFGEVALIEKPVQLGACLWSCVICAIPARRPRPSAGHGWELDEAVCPKSRRGSTSPDVS